MLKLEARALHWPLAEPFAISRGTMTTVDGVLVTIEGDGAIGRGEAYGIIYEHETPDTILADIERARAAVEAGADRAALLDLLPIGGARCAIDCALWDWEAKRSGVPAWQAAGLQALRPVHSAFTVGMRSVDETRATAARFAGFAVLKIKVDGADPLARIEAARAGAPNSRFIVDPNQSWSFEQLVALTPDLQRLGVALLEQPLPIDGDAALAGYSSPIPICADELVDDRSQLCRAVGKYSHLNIKLDKAGGLTEALALADAAQAAGMGLMVGCMAGSSLAMAPAMLLAQRCDFVDLDGPLLQREDWPHPIRYAHGLMSVPEAALWG